jgi:hypothetical protein
MKTHTFNPQGAKTFGSRMTGTGTQVTRLSAGMAYYFWVTSVKAGKARW